MPADSTAVTDELRQIAVSLQHCLHCLFRVHNVVDGDDRDALRDLRWHIAESQRLNRDLHRRLVDRLAGPTPASLPISSSQHPPDGTPGTGQEERRTPP